MKVSTRDYTTYKYSGSIFNRFLQLIKVRPMKKEEYQVTFFGPVTIEINPSD